MFKRNPSKRERMRFIYNIWEENVWEMMKDPIDSHNLENPKKDEFFLIT